MDIKKELKVLDLFAGVGGMSHGFSMAGFDVPGAIEFDKQIAQSMEKNHTDSKIFIEDIKNISPKLVKKEIGEIGIVVGGPPCQGFSLKGKRLGLKDNRNFLFKEFIKYVDYFSPKYFILENVVGLLSSDNGFFKNEIIKEFEKLGYQVDCGIVNAVDFGVPQKRRRTIFIGTRMKRAIKIPEKTVKIPITLWEAISDLAYLESGEGEFASNYRLKPKTSYQKMMRKKSKKLYNHVATNHSELALNRLKRIPPEKGKEYLKEKITSTFGQTWGRLVKNEPSPTIITRFDTPSNGKNSHPFLHRAITPREAARIQSFPDDFIFHGNKTSVIKQIGNAVPPLLAMALANHIKKHYEDNKK